MLRFSILSFHSALLGFRGWLPSQRVLWRFSAPRLSFCTISHPATYLPIDTSASHWYSFSISVAHSIVQASTINTYLSNNTGRTATQLLCASWRGCVSTCISIISIYLLLYIPLPNSCQYDIVVYCSMRAKPIERSQSGRQRFIGQGETEQKI